jgi:hypothetical protein
MIAKCNIHYCGCRHFGHGAAWICNVVTGKSYQRRWLQKRYDAIAVSNCTIVLALDAGGSQIWRETFMEDGEVHYLVIVTKAGTIDL